ncbi:MAG: Sec-independent protein translocase subunit TatA/TatB [Acidimicrobiales bacterium]
MDVLSPAKLLVILVVAIVVLGPDKLPKLARQVGGLWGDFRKFRDRLETDVRGSFPDLPSTKTITDAVRSPISFLDSLAEAHSGENDAVVGTNGASPPGDHGEGVQPPASSNRPTGVFRARGVSSAATESDGRSSGAAHRVRSDGWTVPDDPGLN